MHYDKIKPFDELSDDELDVFGAFRNLKISYDKARFELIDYKLADLIAEYDKLVELRKDIQLRYFEIMDIIKENDLNTIDISYEKWEKARTDENANWNDEIAVLSEYKYAFDEGLELINSGVVEQILIEEEMNLM